jgi:hypothetical protein
MRKIEGAHVWEVRGSLPKDEAKGRPWATNTTMTVCAQTLHRAIKVAFQAHPDIEIHDVVHRGGKHIYLDEPAPAADG